MISKPTKPKPVFIKGVTDKGFNVAFYVESSEGTQAAPTKRFILPIDSSNKEIASLNKDWPKARKIDEGVVIFNVLLFCNRYTHTTISASNHALAKLHSTALHCSKYGPLLFVFCVSPL